MLLTVAEFRERLDYDFGALITDLQRTTGRAGDDERYAWMASLPKLADALSVDRLSELHLYFGSARNVALEYQLPAASSWCDAVLLGKRDGIPRAVIIELKDWQTAGDQAGPYEGLMVRHGSVVLHPSEQVRGYVEYCQRFHSAVADYGADVSGCVLFTKDVVEQPYLKPPNDRLAMEYPCFVPAADVLRERFPRYLADRVRDPSEDFARAFVSGRYRQDRGFVRQIGQQIIAANSSPFVLLDNQRRALAMIRERLERTLFRDDRAPRKQVIIIEGPPGSGKSVLAARIWAELVTDSRLPDGSAVVTTTSTSQTSNWQHLFKQTHRSGAGGVVKKAASYVPISTQRLGALRKRLGPDFLRDASSWRENVQLLRELEIEFQDGAHDDQYQVSIVDEAHALINPEHTEGRGQFGFVSNLGPVAWHIIRSSVVTIMLLDSEQGFRDRENTHVEDIERWARELDAEVGERISLHGAQFRCAGSREFVDWVEGLLAGEPPGNLRPLAARWKKALDFDVVDTPFDLDEQLRAHVASGRTARLLASYARPWRTRNHSNPHTASPEERDFCETVRVEGRPRIWSRVWNYVPRGNDYTWFIQAPEGTPMGDDPLCEVGCPYAVRGFDFDYVGVLWLRDLTWRPGGWHVDPNEVHETGLPHSKRAALRGAGGSETLRRAVAQAYRIILTRGLQGLRVWFEDGETRAHVLECIG